MARSVWVMGLATAAQVPPVSRQIAPLSPTAHPIPLPRM